MTMDGLQEVELVDTDLSIGSNSSDIEIDIEGKYPLQINNHFIVAAVKGDNRRFRCVTCGGEIDISETVWRQSKAENRRQAIEYVIGYFLECNCDSPNTFNDVVSGVMDPYVGRLLTKETIRHIERDLRKSIASYE